MNCLFCGVLVPPGSRAFLKTKDEEIDNIIESLKHRYDFSVRDFAKFLRKGVICRGKCLGLISKLMKLKKDIVALESEVAEKFGEVMLTNDLGRVKDDQVSEDVNSTAESLGKTNESPISQSLSNVTSTPRSRNQKFVGVITICNGKKSVARLPPSLRGLGRSLGRKNRNSIVNHVMKDVGMKQLVINKLRKVLMKEFAKLSKRNSCFTDKGISALDKFNWSTIALKLKGAAPTLFSLLEACTTKTELEKNIVIVVCSSILLKSFCERANLFQRLVSVLLFTGHAPKQLYNQLQKAGICVSHKTTIRIIDEMSTDFDQPVIDWCNNIKRNIWHNNTQLEIVEQSTAIEEQPTDIHVEEQPTELEEQLAEIEEDIASLFPEEDLNPTALMQSGASSEIESASSGAPSSPPSDITISHLSESTFSANSQSDDSVNDNTSSYVLQKPKFESFKLVGDNLDKSVRPRHETVDSHLCSLHYFHSFAVKDRCDTSELQDNPSLPDVDLTSFSFDVILPSEEDFIMLQDNYTIIAARVIQKYIPFFKQNVPKVVRHIRHIHTAEMSQKSDVVPLGVLFKNEVSHEDMIDIMSHLQQYVPCNTAEDEITDPLTNKPEKVYIDQFHHILFGGDQLTVERSVGAKKERINEARGTERLEGLLPVVEDWHAKVAFLKAIWRILYKTSSASNTGTLYQLRNLLMRRSVTEKIRTDPTACEEFFLLVVDGHILSAAMKAFELDSLDATPQSSQFQGDFLSLSPTERRKIFLSSVNELLSDRTYQFAVGKCINDNDSVYTYAKELLSLGMLYLELIDAIREGDGLRILRCWRYLLLIFKVTDKRKYAVQAVTLLFQYEFFFTERMRHQLLWNRTINATGRIGHNIPMDLHMEHLNRNLKSAISHLSSNVSKSTISRLGKSMKKLEAVTSNYDRCSKVSQDTGYHSNPSLTKDLKQIIEELNKMCVHERKEKRKHSQFPRMKGNIVGSIKRPDLDKWLLDHLKRIMRSL